MNRLLAAAAALPMLLASGAFAQSVSDDVNKQLWCGTAMVVAFGNPPPGLTPEQLTEAQGYVDAGNQLIDQAVQAHIDAGFTAEEANRIKEDMVPTVSVQVMGNGENAQYTFEECLAILPTQPAGPDGGASSELSGESSAAM
ncbi:MAG TPA: hypothetical protein VFE52_02860 [Devosia sp.]|jgi:hypothetical protein|nr:hypothetical protein [Devosia sp.]